MRSIKIGTTQTVSEIVRSDYRTADVFRKLGINYCCSGQVTLAHACDIRSLDAELVLLELEDATRSVRLPNSLQFSEWKLDFLADYIANVHHAFIYQAAPSLESGLDSFISSHKNKFQELVALQETFSELVRVLIPHCKHEDEVILPYIKQIEAAHRRNETYGNLLVKTLRKSLSCIETVHDEISDLLQELKRCGKNYIFPENACTNHQVIFHKLREFHDDMLQHMHLENNILYPRAKQIELHLLGL